MLLVVFPAWLLLPLGGVMELLPMSMVQMRRNKLRDPRGLLLLLVGPRWFVRLGVGTSTSVWESFSWSWGF